MHDVQNELVGFRLYSYSKRYLRIVDVSTPNTNCEFGLALRQDDVGDESNRGLQDGDRIPSSVVGRRSSVVAGGI